MSRQVRNVTSDATSQGLAATINIDRDSAARLSITAATVDEALYSAFGQRIVSTIFTDTNQYRVILEEKPGVVTSPENLDLVNVQTGSGTADAAHRDRVAFMSRVRRCRSIGSGSSPRRPSGSIRRPASRWAARSDEIRDADCTRSDLPVSLTTTFLGAANAFQASLQNELWLILAAIVCVYIVLGVLYESYIHPLTILSTLPSAGVGALLALLVTGSDLGVIGIIGIILLIGIVKKNAIMMIDFAIEAERAGKTPRAVDSRSRAAAIPPDPDDDVRRPVRRRAADAGLRPRLGAASSAGCGHLRRVDRQSAAHAVHDAGDLSGVRPPEQEAAREPLGALRQTAGRHDTARRVARARRHRRVLRAAGRAVAAGGFPDGLRQRQSCPAPAPKPWRRASPRRSNAASASSRT